MRIEFLWGFGWFRFRRLSYGVFKGLLGTNKVLRVVRGLGFG